VDMRGEQTSVAEMLEAGEEDSVGGRRSIRMCRLSRGWVGEMGAPAAAIELHARLFQVIVRRGS